MKHFETSDWSDFARGCAAEADRAAMEAHLASGCRRCRAASDIMQRVVASTKADERYEPPPNIVRYAKAISAMHRPLRTPLAGLVARLVFDSFDAPLAAGVRAEDRLTRHTVYEAGDFLMELSVEQGEESPMATLVGQVTNRTDPAGSLAGAPVLLMARKDVVAHAVYNRFGEFQLDYRPSRHLRLCVALAPPDQRIEVSLDRLAGKDPKKPDHQ